MANTLAQAEAALRDLKTIFGEGIEQGFAIANQYREIDQSSPNALEQLIALNEKYKAFAAEINPRLATANSLVASIINGMPPGSEKESVRADYASTAPQLNQLSAQLRTVRDEMRAAIATLEKAAAEKVDESTKETPATEGENKSPDDESDEKPANNVSTPATSTSSAGAPTASANRPVAKRLFNPLRDFSSSTYKISLYAITPESLNSYFTTGFWKTTELELLIQSGGVTKNVDSVRNRFFNYDFSIDDLEITTLTNAKETGTASNSVDFKFKIHEPYAMTFPTRLLAAQQDLQRRANIKTPLKQQTQALAMPLRLVVRFYGYDVNGEIIGSSVNTNTGSQTKTDDKAAFERAWPIQITKLNFKLENKVTVYDMQAKTVNEQVGLGTKRGIVPSPVSILADTVESALGGVPNGSGLFDRLNAMQTQITNTDADKKKQNTSDVYKVRFVDTAIKEALIVDKDFYVKSRAPMAQVKNSAQSTVRTASQTTTVDKKKRVIDIASGTSVLTAIDQIISQSTYLTDAMKVVDDEESQPTLENEQTFVKNEPKPLFWYSVVPETKIIGYDNLRNDYAYEIVYVIYKYEVPYLKSLVSGNSTNYRGPSKIYNYWYTGKNTEVLSYEQQYNLLYFLGAALGSDSGTIPLSGDTTPNKAIPGQNANPMGKESGKMELQNSIKTFLYSPGDQIKAQIKILGDPDYLMPIGGPVTDNFTINPNTGQVFIEIDFKQVEDYNIDSTGIASDTLVEHGLLKPNDNIVMWDYPPAIKKVTEGRMVFMVTRVVSRFNKGTFTQDLRTILPNFPSSGSEASAPTSSNNRPAQNTVVDARGRATAATDSRVQALAEAGSSNYVEANGANPPSGATDNARDDSGESAPTTATTRSDDNGREEPRVDLTRGTRGGA